MQKLWRRLRALYKQYPYVFWLALGSTVIWKIHADWQSTAIHLLAWCVGSVSALYILTKLEANMGLRRYREHYAEVKGFPYDQLVSLVKAKPGASAYECVGFRFARLWLMDDVVQFQSMTRWDTFGVRAQATCGICDDEESGESHSAPDPDCTCGFYSQNSLANLCRHLYFAHNPNVVLLMCSYTGRVIPGFRGWRAQTQHVLKVWVPNRCSIEHCTAASEYMGTLTEVPPNLLPDEFGRLINDGLVPLCREHAPEAIKVMSLLELRQHLPTEFTFASE